MRKLWIAGVLALGATVACEPETPPPTSTEVVVARFDPGAVPPVVPTPNDLAINPDTGLVEAPVDPDASPAQQEFTRDYLNTLDGFPTSSVATTPIPDLDPATLSASTVRFIDLKPQAGLPTVTPELGYDAQKGLLTVTPPRSGWPKGGHYAVVVIGGPNGVKGTGDKPVVGSPTWSLLRAPTPLVQCQEGVEPTPDTCQATTLLLPSTQTDPTKRKREQAATALRLEALRLRYEPVLDQLEDSGIRRVDVALLWTFTVMSLPEVTFAPEQNVLPFPNDLLLTRDASGPRVNVPVPPGSSAEQKALLEGLNTLDGFSTTAPIVSENSDTRGAIDLGRLDASRLPTATRFLKLTATGTVPQPHVEVCLDCRSSKKADGSTPTTHPSQLQFFPRVPLEEKSTYAVVMTTGLRNDRGQRVVPAGAFALLRSSAPLVDASGKSQVSGVLDTQAQQLEAGRKALKPFIDGLVASGLPRRDITLAWAFTTQSTVSSLRKLHALPTTVGAVNPERLPAAPRYLLDVTTDIKSAMGSLPSDKIGKVFQGQLVVPFALTGPGGTMKPELLRFDRIPFLLALPATAAPETGYPVTIFGHGLRGNHQHLLTLANALAGSGRAVVAIDTVKHGERSMCVGSAAVLRTPQNPTATDDWACAKRDIQRCDNEPASPTFGRCIARPAVPRTACAASQATADLTCAAAGEGRCLDTDPTGDDDQCEGGTFAKNADGSVAISGWNMLDLQNFFVTRDNFRHQVIDLAQLVRVLQGEGIDTQLGAAGPLDGTRIDYVGQSLGGILGTLYGAVSPDAHHMVLNVPGGRLTQVLDESTHEDFVAMRTLLYGTLATRQMPQGSPAFDTYVRTAQWIVDPADPVNYAWHVSNGAQVPARRRALLQYITGDILIPNSTTQALIDAANARGDGARPMSVSRFNPTEAQLAPNDRHAFLNNGKNPLITQQAQDEVVQFLNDTQ